MFETITEKNLHHAYVVVGNIEESRSDVLAFLPRIGIAILGNPDVQHSKIDTVTKDIAEDLAVAVSQKDFSGSKKIFIVEANIITEEAQNALLKVFEEPTFGTHFFILIPQDILLPTFRSRVQIVVQTNGSSSATSFLQMSMAERIATVKEMTDSISDEDKTKQDAIALLNSIESELYMRGAETSAQSLSICEDARRALYDRGAPVKMILEHVMLTI